MAYSYANGLSAQATPTRDRLPFPHSAQPSPGPSLRQTAASSASSSLTHLPSTTSTSSAPSVQASPQTITVDALLRQFAAHPDPKSAALDQAVADRNVLSAQNSQLWKLIEKQRTGYNQILKELERIRGERDTYKVRLVSLTGNGAGSNGNGNGNASSHDRRHKTPSERSRPSLDTTSTSSHGYASSAAASPAVAIAPLAFKNPTTRHNSDDSVAQHRSLTQPTPLHSSRSFDPQSLSSSSSIRQNQNGIDPHSNVPNTNTIITTTRTSSPPPAPPSSAPSLSHPPSTRQSRPSPSPLVVPTRADTLPASYTISDSPESSTSTRQPGFYDPSTPNANGNGNGAYSSYSNTTRAPPPIIYPRKSSLAESVSSIITSGTGSSAASMSSPSSVPSSLNSAYTFGGGGDPTTPSQQQYQIGAVPLTAPPAGAESAFAFPRQRHGHGHGNGNGNGNGNGHANANPSISSFASSSIPAPSSAAASSQSLSLAAPGLDTRPHILSRDSRISLPDEARQYIANMADSPAASPRAEAFSPRSKLSTSVFPPPQDTQTGNGRESEFLDMDEEDDDEEDEEEEEEDMDGISREEEEGDGQGDRTAGAIDSPFNGLKPGNSQTISNNTHTNTNNTNTNDLAGFQYPPSEYPHNNNYNTPHPSNAIANNNYSEDNKRKDKSRVAAEEFPLPPPAPSNIFMQRQQALAAQQELQAQYQQQHQQQQMSMQGQGQAQYQQATPLVTPSKHAQATADQLHHMSGNHIPPHDSQAAMAESAYLGQQSAAYRSETSFQSQQSSQSQSQQQQQQQSQSQAPSQPERQDTLPQSQSAGVQPIPASSFRALPLLSSDLPQTNIVVSHSFVRPNDRGKEVLSFIVFVNPGNGKDGWKVEKMYSDVLSLDQRVRNSVGKGVGKKIANLPEGKLWKDHAPAKVDQRKAVLENYLQTLIQLPVKNNDEVIAFFTSDIVREQKQPVMQAGHKEGYLTKRGKNFGGWKTRFFVLQGPVLEYYDCRGGAHLGSITITGAQIARQHRTERPPTTDDEKEYRHAFLIVEAKKGPGGNHPRHVLCAESDEDRDSWVEMLVRYYTGTYSDDLVFNPASGLTSVQTNSVAAAASQSSVLGMSQPRSSSSSSSDLSSNNTKKGSAIPISVQAGADEYMRSSSPSRSVDPSPIDRQGPSPFDPQKRVIERSTLGLPSSLPDSSPLSAAAPPSSSDASFNPARANSELGHYSDQHQRQHSPERHRRNEDTPRKSFYPTLNTVAPSTAASHSPAPVSQQQQQPDRVPSPEKPDAKVKISGPMNGAPIPSGFKFGGKEPSSADPATAAANDRREKAKSRSFWGFGKANGDKSHLHAAYPPRAVFGVPLEEALDVAQMCNLPAIVFRSIQYLEAKKADQEEGIYRLSGSSAVIKNLKDMFNNEGDVDLLASDEYWDPHAIAGLLKSFLRELPSSILTRDLHLKFLAVIDFVDPQERIKELSQLIAALPLANYSLLRALTAHLILIVQNSNVNKMTMRNVGIVFSPTLGIPAGVFSLMLGEFNRVFNVDADNEPPPEEGVAGAGGAGEGAGEEPYKRNSRQYTDAAADQVLGLAGRTLSTADETQSDGDDFSIQDESGTETTEGEITIDSSSSSSPVSAPRDASSRETNTNPNSRERENNHGIRVSEPDTPATPTAKTPTSTNPSKASSAAASRGLNVAVTHSDRGNRHSRMMGLPSSPRPGATHASPGRLEVGAGVGTAGGKPNE